MGEVRGGLGAGEGATPASSPAREPEWPKPGSGRQEQSRRPQGAACRSLARPLSPQEQKWGGGALKVNRSPFSASVLRLHTASPSPA